MNGFNRPTKLAELFDVRKGSPSNDDGLIYSNGLWIPGHPTPMKQKVNVTRWVIPGWFVSSTNNTLITADRIYYAPIFVSETTTYIRIGIRVQSGSIATAVLRIYNWSNGLPSSLILSEETGALWSVGWHQVTISQELNRGYYFLAVRTSGAPTLYGCSPAGSVPPVPGISVGASINPLAVIPYVDAAFADPAPAPTGILTTGYGVVALREN